MAVSIRRLTPEETQRVFPRRGQQDLGEYVAALRELGPGEAAEIEREGLTDRTIKRRLGMAAKQLGYRLKWARQSSPETMYFQIIGTLPTKMANGRRRRRVEPSPSAPPAGAAPEPTAPRSGRGRRRRAA